VIQWLQQIPAERIIMWIFLAGVAWSRLHAATKSLRDQGRRIGALATRVARLEAAAGVQHQAGGDGG
jgi:hypothetical protein